MPFRTVKRILLAWVIIMALVALLGKVTVAASNEGRTAADFLRIGQDARAAGLSGAFTALSTGASATYWNPAGIGADRHVEALLGHTAWYQDIALENGAVSFALGDRGGLGVSFTVLDYGDINAYSSANNQLGLVTARDWVAGLSGSWQLTDDLAFGITGKYIAEELDQLRGEALAADLGLRYRLNNVVLAAAVSNIGTKLTYNSSIEEELPALARVGVAVELFDRSVVTAADIEKSFNGDIVVRHGLEFGYHNQYFLRSGYSLMPSQDVRTLGNGFTFGGGLRFGVARLDYAFTPSDSYLSEELHRFSLTIGL